MSARVTPDRSPESHCCKLQPQQARQGKGGTRNRFPPAQPLNLNRVANLSIQLHAFIPRPLPLPDKGHLLPDSYSGATGLPRRFRRDFCAGRFHRTVNRCRRAAGLSVRRA
jgi:hypothetical protein